MRSLCAISFFRPIFPIFPEGSQGFWGAKVLREYSDMKRRPVAGPAGLARLGMLCLVVPLSPCLFVTLSFRHLSFCHLVFWSPCLPSGRVMEASPSPARYPVVPLARCRHGHTRPTNSFPSRIRRSFYHSTVLGVPTPYLEKSELSRIHSV